MSTSSKKTANQLRLAIVNLINNRFMEYNNNIIAIEIVSRILGIIVDCMTQNFVVDENIIICVLDKALEVTKSDPLAQPGKYDQLLAIYELYLKTMRLPTISYEFRTTLLLYFIEVFGGSHRRHSVKRDGDSNILIQKILSTFSFLEPGIIYPTLPQKKGTKKRIAEKLKLIKRSQEEKETEL